MKVLHIQKVKGLAGSEKYFSELLPRLNELNVTTEFVCLYKRKDEPNINQFISLLKEKKIKTHLISYKSDLSSRKIIKQLKKIVQKTEADIIHSHLIHADFWCALLKKFYRLKTAVVSTKHGYEESYIAKYGFDASHINKKGRYYQLCKFSEKQIDASFAVSDGLKKLFIDAGICDKNKMSTIHHGFDLPDVSHLRKSDYRYSQKQIVVLGRIIPFKGHIHLFEAMPHIVAEHPEVKLLVIGDGDEDVIAQLKSVAGQKGFDKNVSFLGFKSNIYDYLVNSDIMAVPSIAEGFGLIFLEAMNAKIPIVGFDVSATNEIIVDEESGYLISPYNSNEMADKISQLLSDPSKRASFGENGYKRLKKYFSLDRMTNQTIDFYHAVLRDKEK